MKFEFLQKQFVQYALSSKNTKFDGEKIGIL